MIRRSLNNALSAASLTLVPLLAFAQPGGGQPDYLIVFSGMALGLIVVALVIVAVVRVQRLRYETIRAMVEKGQEIPEQLLGPRYPHGPPRERLTPYEGAGYSIGWGVLASFLGLGIGLANFLSSGDIRSAAWGLIFVCLGLGLMTNGAWVRYNLRRHANDGGR